MTDEPRDAEDPTPPEADITEDDARFGNDHPLSSPGELAGTADRAIAAELAALDPDPDEMDEGGLGPGAGDELASG